MQTSDETLSSPTPSLRQGDPVPASLPPLPRPPAWQESLGAWLFQALSPRLPRVTLPSPPNHLAPFESIPVARSRGEGSLSGTWYPASGEARGAVLLMHPWMEWGQTYFHRRGRIEALRKAGLHALSVDLPGFGSSGSAEGLYDWAVDDALAELNRRASKLPLYLWGVSSGGYWSHPALTRTERVRAAVFEDVSPHLLEWSWRMSPWGRPFYLLFRYCIPAVYRYLDIRRHAESLNLEAVTYISGENDRGVPPEDTRTLAQRAGGQCHIISGAGHLTSIKRANQEILSLALETFGVDEWPGSERQRDVAAG